MLETRSSTTSNDIHQSFLTIYHINDTDRMHCLQLKETEVSEYKYEYYLTSC